MNMSCKVIEDMLPMYYDGVCSAESAALIEEHLKDCHHCSLILSDLRSDIGIPEKKVVDIKPLKKLQKSYKKMRMHWLLAILATLLLIPIAFFVGVKQSKQVAEYSQEEALAYGNAFMTALIEGDYAKAYSHWDIEAKKQQWLKSDDFEEEDLVNMEADGRKKFCEMGEKLEALGGLEAFELLEISDNGYDYRANKKYGILYRVKFDGKDETFDVGVTENGIYHIGAADGLIAHPLSQLCLWGHWLYDDYLGRYYDYDLKEYVYYDKEN